QHFVGQSISLVDQHVTLVVYQARGGRLAAQVADDLPTGALLNDLDLVVLVLEKPSFLFFLNHLGPLVLIDALARKDLSSNDRALNAGTYPEGGVPHIAGLLTKDGAEELL